MFAPWRSQNPVRKTWVSDYWKIIHCLTACVASISVSFYCCPQSQSFLGLETRGSGTGNATSLPWHHRQPKRTICGFGLQRSSDRNILELLVYSQLSLRRTPLEPALAVRLIESQIKGVKKGRDQLWCQINAKIFKIWSLLVRLSVLAALKITKVDISCIISNRCEMVNLQNYNKIQNHGLDFLRLPGPVWVRAHFPEQRVVIEPNKITT